MRGQDCFLAEGDLRDSAYDRFLGELACCLPCKLDVGLIVMSSHGHTGFKHLWVGSVAERVVQHAPWPVLIVRPPGGPVRSRDGKGKSK